MHNPPAVGNPKTIYYREILYTGLVAISGSAALGLAFLYRKLHSIASKIIQMLPNLYQEH
ncbi:MAG TPA: CbtA family protein [Nitrososphaeraceae archaeon]|nr:CbtA family protein [Nitrososphaeraceae archaeon]